MNRLVTATLACAMLPAPAAAQTDSLMPRLDRAARYLQSANAMPGATAQPRWLPGDRMVFRSDAGPERGAFMLVDAARGIMTTLASASSLAAATGGPLPVFAPWAITPDSARIVFRAPNGGWSLSIADGAIGRADSSDPDVRAVVPGALRSPTGLHIAQPRGAGFAVTDSAGRTVLEQAGEERYSWQLANWSPDGRYLVAWRNDQRGVHTIPIVDYRSPVERVDMVPYSKSGTPLPREEMYIIEPAAGRIERVTLPDGEAYHYPAHWRLDGSEVLFFRLSRDGKRLDLHAVRASDRSTRVILTEQRPETFVGALDFAVNNWPWQIRRLADGSGFLWISERDGWRHVYHYGYDGRLRGQVTRGAMTVHRVLREAGGVLHVIASADSAAPYDMALYRVSLNGRDFRRLTPEPGVHDVTMSPTGRFFADFHSSRARAPRLQVRPADRAGPGVLAQVADTTGFAPAPESLSVRLDDGTMLYGIVYKPADFDPARRYAVIDYIYGGPWLNVVQWDYRGSFMARQAGAFAQMGFVVVMIDARGTPGRGKAFQDHNYGRIGQTEIGEHVAAIRRAAATRPWMDTTRAGIFGHSWGGYYALRGILTAPEFFDAGYAGAPGALGEEALINEPNMNLESANAEGWRIGANEPLAANLRGALKMMHGTSDANASLSTTMRMADALIRANRRFELLLMPGQPHGPQGPAQRYYQDDILRFFWSHLGGPR